MVGVALALVPAAVASATPGRGCAKKESHVQQRAGLARVFLYRGELYACRPGLRVDLGFPEDTLPETRCPNPIALVRLQPKFVAWYEDRSCDDQKLWFIHVRQLERHGTHRAMLDGIVPCGNQCPSGGIGPPTQLALTRGGSVAWIATDAFANDGTREVWKALWDQPKVRVARGLGIDPHQLHWRGRHVAYMLNGQAATG
jgi:hypothetical protein